MNPRLGVTLIELLVALAVLGLLTGVVVLQVRPVRRLPGDWRADSIAAVRRRAVAEGAPRTAILASDPAGAHAITALPDGRVIADSAVDVDAFTGRVREAR